jgi:hypothetical protein
MNQPSTTWRTQSPARRRLLVLAGILVISTVLSLALAIADAVELHPLNWVVIGLTAAAAVAMWLVFRSRPLDKRIAYLAIGVMAARVLFSLLLQFGTTGYTSVTFVFGVGLPIFFLYYLISSIKEIQQEAPAR